MLQFGRVCSVEWLFVLKQKNNQWCCWGDDGHYSLTSALRATVKPPEVQEEGEVSISSLPFRKKEKSLILLTGWLVWYTSLIHWVLPRPPTMGNCSNQLGCTCEQTTFTLSASPTPAVQVNVSNPRVMCTQHRVNSYIRYVRKWNNSSSSTTIQILLTKKYAQTIRDDVKAVPGTSLGKGLDLKGCFLK